MFKKLYGETEELQFEYLKKRVIVSVVPLVLLLISLPFASAAFGQACAGIASFIYVISLLMWAWGYFKMWFGWATFGAIFTGNIVFGVVIFVLFIMIGTILGLVGMLIGTGRFIYLCVKRMQQRS